jgi:protein phosphatase
MRIVHAARTDVGLKRDNNEDNYLVYPEEGLFAVFDGMGGHAAGEVASGMAAQEMREFFELTGRDREATWPFKEDRARSYEENRLVTAIKLGNQRILDAADIDPSKKNMGTTCVAAYFVEHGSAARAIVAHAGDSRVYLLRDGRLRRITIDHSLVEEYLSGMVDDPGMESILLRSTDLPALARKLLDAANANGGIDNSTVILARYEGV